MRNIYILLIIVFLFACGCTNRENADAPDQAKLIASLEKISDQYLVAWNNKDLNTLDELTSDKGEYYGSAPEEIMDKQGLMEMYSLFFEDTTSSYKYTVDSRNIRISSDGNSVIIYERIIFQKWSPEMPLCQTSHLIKIKGKWKIDFISWGFIIKNGDVEKVNEIL